MAKKLVKVCLHSSKAVQISLQFDEFFLTKKFHSNYTNFSKTLTLYSWTKSSFESFFIALQLLRHPTRDRQDIIKNLGLIGESQLSCGLFFARLLLIKRDNFFQHCLHHFTVFVLGDRTETTGNWDMLPSMGLRAPCASAEDLTCHEDSPGGLTTDEDEEEATPTPSGSLSSGSACPSLNCGSLAVTPVHHPKTDIDLCFKE